MAAMYETTSSPPSPRGAATARTSRAPNAAPTSFGAFAPPGIAPRAVAARTASTRPRGRTERNAPPAAPLYRNGAAGAAGPVPAAGPLGARPAGAAVGTPMALAGASGDEDDVSVGP